MAWKAIDLQEHICLAGTTTYTILQDEEDWPQIGDYRMAVLDFQVAGMRGCTLYVEGCEAQDGVWTVVRATPGGCFEQQFYLNRKAPQGSPDRLPRYLRWRLEADSIDWLATFQLGLTLRD
jgi:hypothetical protein